MSKIESIEKEVRELTISAGSSFGLDSIAALALKYLGFDLLEWITNQTIYEKYFESRQKGARAILEKTLPMLAAVTKPQKTMGRLRRAVAGLVLAMALSPSLAHAQQTFKLPIGKSGIARVIITEKNIKQIKKSFYEIYNIHRVTLFLGPPIRLHDEPAGVHFDEIYEISEGDASNMFLEGFQILEMRFPAGGTRFYFEPPASIIVTKENVKQVTNILKKYQDDKRAEFIIAPPGNPDTMPPDQIKKITKEEDVLKGIKPGVEVQMYENVLVSRLELNHISSSKARHTVFDPNSKNSIWVSVSKEFVMLNPKLAFNIDEIKKMAEQAGLTVGLTNDFDRMLPIFKRTLQFYNKEKKVVYTFNFTTPANLVTGPKNQKN